MRRLFVLAAAAAIAAIGMLGSCGPKPTTVLLPNEAPTVRLTAAPPTYSPSDRYFYSITMNWVANDPDGRVDHFLVAVVDLPGVRGTLSDSLLDDYAREPRWVRTDRSDTTIRFGSTQSRPDTLWADDSHIFMIKAVDNQGRESGIQQRAFFSTTLAPTVQITSPIPSRFGPVFVTPSVLIRWDGEDADGVLSRKPVKYKYKLFNEQSDPTHTAILASPDYRLLRDRFVPTNWAGWDSTSSDTTTVQFRNLIPSKEYLFVVIAFDEAGAYSPVFERDQNMLLMRVTFAGNNNPVIGMWNDFFFYVYPAGSYEPNNPERVVPLEIPADEPVTFNWLAVANVGSEMRSYRWALDIVDLNDNTERTDQQTDLAHWSPKLQTSTSATIGPFAGTDQVRKFYIEAEDINGLKSLGIIGFTVVQPAWTKPGDPSRPLLVVKDVRLIPDMKAVSTQTCVNRPPSNQWPTSAELDSFLFARGGFPWRCYDPGDQSMPGIMKGFDFDTISTRVRSAEQTVRLSTLAQYRHVVWMADKQGAVPTDGTTNAPQSALAYMTGPNRANTLATYVRMGGKVWVLGGGAMTATLFHYDRAQNNTIPPAPSKTFSFDLNELLPGRFMFDIAKWQVEAKVVPRANPLEITRHLGRNANDPYFAAVPPRLDFKLEAAGDSFPPGRTPRIDGNFYLEFGDIEYMSRPNLYFADPNNPVASLDTLYQAAGPALVQTNIQNPTNFVNACMTIYPARSLSAVTGALPNQVIFSGFDIWTWRKSQCRDLTRFVLSNLWGLNPNATLGAPRSPAVRAAAGAPKAPVLAPQGPRPERGAVQGGRPARTAETVRSPRANRSGSGRGE